MAIVKKEKKSSKRKVKMEKVYIRITLFHPPGREDIAKIHLIELSPPTFNGRVKYGITGHDEEHSFDELQKDLKIEEENGQIHKYSIKRGQTLGLFLVNTETKKKQIFGIKVSKGWPEYTTGGSPIRRSEYIDITPHLQKIGIL